MSVDIDISSGAIVSGMPADPLIWCPYMHCAGDRLRTIPWISPKRLLTHWLAVVSLEGREEIEVDGRAYDIPSGSSYVIQPGSMVRLQSRSASRPAWIHFDLAWDSNRVRHPQVHVYTPELGARAPWLQPRAAAILGCDLPVIVPQSLQARFRLGLRAVVIAWRRGDRLSVNRAAQELGLLMLAYAEHVQGDSGTGMSSEERVVRAEAAVRGGLHIGAGLADMAAAAGLGRSRFCDLYRKLRGISPGEFVRNERLARAQELLSRADTSVVDIAAQVGHADATVFGRFFRSATRMTPTAWRNRPMKPPRRGE